MRWQLPHTRNINTHQSPVCRADQRIPAVIHCYIGAVRERHTRNIDTHQSPVCRADQRIPAGIHCYIGAVCERLQVVDVEKVKDSEVEREEVQDAMLT